MDKNYYKDVLEKINKILLSADPVGLIQMGAPKSEYNSLAEDIILLLQRPHTADSLTGEIYNMFVKGFDSETAGNKGKYKSIAEEVNNL